MRHTTLKVLICFIIVFATNALRAGELNDKADGVSAKLSIKKGQVFSIVSPDNKDGGENAVREYYQRAFPLAESFGLQRHLSLSVGNTLVGEYKPNGFIFFSWPNQESENKLLNHSSWAEIKALRPQGWDELKIYSALAESDIDITFDSNKFYTLAVAWFNPNNPDDYNTYLDGITEAVNEIGGKFILKVHNPRFEAHASPLNAPGQITLVEWNDANGLPALQQSEAFKKWSPYLTSGVTAFELHNIIPVS